MDLGDEVLLKELDSIVVPHATVDVSRLSLRLDFALEPLVQWSSLLRFLNPTQLTLRSAGGAPSGIAPTVTRVPYKDVVGLFSCWKRLEVVRCYGSGSIPLLAVESDHPSPSRFALARDGKPQAKDERHVYAVQYGVLVDGSIYGPSISENEIEDALKRPRDGPAGRLGLYFFLTNLDDDEESN